jgi:hypothetical protein
MRQLFALLCSVLFLLTSTGIMANSTSHFGLEIGQSEDLPSIKLANHQKMYVCHTDLLITENDLFLIGSDELIPLQEIGLDEHGFYVTLLKGAEIKPSDGKGPKCQNGHAVYHRKDRYNGCGGCANWACVFRCKCHSPW